MAPATHENEHSTKSALHYDTNSKCLFHVIDFRDVLFRVHVINEYITTH